MAEMEKGGKDERRRGTVGEGRRLRDGEGSVSEEPVDDAPAYGPPPMAGSPIDTDIPGAFAAGNVADSLEYADLEADAEDKGPQAADVSRKEAVERLKRARPGRRP